MFGTAAAAFHTSRLMSRLTAANVELGSIDGSVGGNNFTPTQFLDYLSSNKLTWAMLSLPAGERFATKPRSGRSVSMRIDSGSNCSSRLARSVRAPARSTHSRGRWKSR